jgi:hypothetical protein
MARSYELNETTRHSSSHAERRPPPAPPSYSQSLYRFAQRNQERPFALSFRLLHRLNIIDHQNELAKLKSEISKEEALSREKADDLRELLRDYGILLFLSPPNY